MKKTKLVTSVFMALAFFAMSVPAFAAENIGKVYVNIGPGEDDFNAGETRGGIEPSVGDDSKYHIDEYSVSDQSQEVRKAYTYNITIDAESGYSFSDSTDIEVYGATNVSVQKKGSNEIKIKAKTYPFHVLANPRKIKIDGKKGTWDAVPNASKYNVVIYYTNSNGDEKSTKKTVSTTNIDLRNFVDKYSDVRLSVQALKGTKDTDRFLSNSDYVFEDGSVDAFQSGPWDYAAAVKAVGKDNLGVAVYPTVNIGGQDVQQKAFMGVKLYAVNQTPSKGNAERIAASYQLAQALTSKDSQNNQFTNEDRHIIPANKEVQASEAVQKDALAQAVITMGSSDQYTTVMPKLSQMSVFWTESAALMSDAYNGKIKEDQFLTKLQQFDKDLAAAK